MKEIKFDGETGKLPEHEFHVPPVREVRKQIRIELGTIIRSHKELDGVIRDENAIYEILCLMRALELLPARERMTAKEWKRIGRDMAKIAATKR